MQIEEPKTQEEIVIKAASIYFGLDVKEYTESRSIDQNTAYQRFIGIYLLRQHTLFSYDKIGKMFCRKGCAVKNAFNQISGLEAVKDRRTIADLKEIKIIIDRFTNQKKKQYA